MRKIGLVLALLTIRVAGTWGQTSAIPGKLEEQHVTLPNIRQLPVPISKPNVNGVYDSTNGAERPKLVHAVAAIFPADPNPVNLKHGSTLEVVFGADGVPGDIKVLGKPLQIYDDAAITAVRQSTFTPGKFHGNPVPTRSLVWVPFLDSNTLASPEMFPLKDFHAPIPMNSVEAEYSDEARNAGYQGAVVVSTLIDTDGQPTEIRALSTVGMGLDEKAVQAVAKYKFRPASKYGIPFPMKINLIVNFRLSSEK